MLVYGSSLDNQHEAMRKFVKRWFGPYAITSPNDNDTYHLAELNRTRVVVSVVGKRIKAFKKWHEDEPNPRSMDDDNDWFGADKDSKSDG